MTPGGVVLCGGRSTRMGTPKAWLPAGPETFLGRTVRVLGDAGCWPLVVVAAAGQELPPLPPGVDVVRDPAPGLGPLAGLAAGLGALAGRCEVAFVAACDLPHLSPDAVRTVLAGRGGASACVPVTVDGPHPLAAAYWVDAAGVATGLLAAGRRRLLDLLAAVPTVTLPADGWAAALHNVNTPADLPARSP